MPPKAATELHTCCHMLTVIIKLCKATYEYTQKPSHSAVAYVCM